MPHDFIVIGSALRGTATEVQVATLKKSALVDTSVAATCRPSG